MFDWLRRRRRVAIRRRPFPAEWRAIIERNVPYVACLKSEDREELARPVQKPPRAGLRLAMEALAGRALDLAAASARAFGVESGTTVLCPALLVVLSA